MAKILCAYSSIEFTCEHFPIYLHHRETYHPIFNISQRKLLPYLHKWAGSELTAIDSYLLFLALLNSTELVEFRIPVRRTNQTDSIVAQNMESLAKTVSRLNAVQNPAVQFPRFVISADTFQLQNVHHWIEIWNNCYEDFLQGARKDYDNRKLAQREMALERLIKNPHKPINLYASQLADWAAVAGSFPGPVEEYWKSIIQKCCNDSQIFSLPVKHIQELLDHCESEINAIGSIFSHKLFEILRRAIHRHKSFLGPELWDDISIPNYTILETDSSSNVELANIKSIVDSAPTVEPKASDFAKRFEYLRAKLKYDLAKRYGKT